MAMWPGVMRCAPPLSFRRRANVDAARRQRIHLAQQHRRIDDRAVADEAQDAGVDDARRDEVELEDLAADGDGVAGVVAAAIAGHDGRALGQPVGDVALALVAPLRADDDISGM
jgi:hypothetical protein